MWCLFDFNKQLSDQLPRGKFHLPSNLVLTETKSAPKHNIITERDFAQLDRMLTNKPNISGISLSGCLMFQNNKTIDWLTNLPESELQKHMTRARKEAPSARVFYKERLKLIMKTRQDTMRQKQEIRAKKEEQRKHRNECLTTKLSGHGGLWLKVQDMDVAIQDLEAGKKFVALADQIRFRKNVLKVQQPDKRLLQLSERGKPFTSKELYNHLSSVLSHSESSVAEASVKPHVNLRTSEERGEIIKSMISRKLASPQNSKSDAVAAKKRRQVLPNLVGKRIQHKWETEGGTEWWEGRVLHALQNPAEVNCQFEVQYIGDQNIYVVPLYEDYLQRDLVVTDITSGPLEKVGTYQTYLLFASSSAVAFYSGVTLFACFIRLSVLLEYSL